MGIPSGNEKLLMRSNHVVLPVSSGKLQRKFPKTGGDKHHCLISLLKYMHHSHAHTHTHTHTVSFSAQHEAANGGDVRGDRLLCVLSVWLGSELFHSGH